MLGCPTNDKWCHIYDDIQKYLETKYCQPQKRLREIGSLRARSN